MNTAKQRTTTAQVGRQAFRPREVCDVLGVSLSGVYAGIRAGRIRCVRFGGRILIPQAEIDRILGDAQ